MEENINSKDLLNEVSSLLHKAVIDRKSQNDSFMGLLEQSEKRIDNVNRMITDLTNVIQHLTDTYAKHLDSLSSCRDAVVEQNQQLTRIITKQQDDLDRERDRNAELVRQMIEVARGVSGTSVNVH